MAGGSRGDVGAVRVVDEHKEQRWLRGIRCVFAVAEIVRDVVVQLEME